MPCGNTGLISEYLVSIPLSLIHILTDGKMKAAGIRKGFIILKANGQPVKSVNDLEDVLKADVYKRQVKSTA